MTLDDIYIYPAPISFIKSRNDTDTSITLCGEKLSIPLIASNMASVFSPEQARILTEFGTKSVVHRFTSIEDNVDLFRGSLVDGNPPWVSVGVSDHEFKRAQALVDAGAKVLVLEVANASHISCIEQYRRLRTAFTVPIVVGTFATKEQVRAFVEHSGTSPDAILVGIGNGAACTTGSDVTGIHIPIADTILSTVQVGIPVIVSGGVSKPADLVKCLALGATAVMAGKIFSACYESGAKGFFKEGEQYFKDFTDTPHYKYYHGSAAKEAYEDTNKTAKWRPVEGKGLMIRTTGSTEEMLTYYQSSLRSALSYLNAKNMDEFKANVKWDKK